MMKQISFIFLLVIATLITSCSWFHRNPHFLVGSWRIDSLHIAKDANAIGYLLLAMGRQEDSSKADLSFTRDSIIFYAGEGTEKTAYHFTADNELILNDSTNEHFLVEKINDSLIAVQSKDSSILFLKKI